MRSDLISCGKLKFRSRESLNAQKEAAIVNISSGLAFVPLPIAPIYCATKAAVHSFTQFLRVQLKNTRVRAFEVAPR